MTTVIYMVKRNTGLMTGLMLFGYLRAITVKTSKQCEPTKQSPLSDSTGTNAAGIREPLIQNTRQTCATNTDKCAVRVCERDLLKDKIFEHCLIWIHDDRAEVYVPNAHTLNLCVVL